MKTSELTGASLDWAVAKADDNLYPVGDIRVGYGEVFSIEPGDYETAEKWKQYSPSTDWAQGGPIIEELIKGHFFVMEDGDGDGEQACHVAYSRTPHDNFHGSGPTPLIAAMRCYVASKLGDEVDVPTELK